MFQRNAAIALLIFLGSFAVYRANDGYLCTNDSAPNSLLFFNAVENRTFAFDAFAKGYLYDSGGGYIFTTAPNGHLEPIYPIGAALLASPIYLAEYLAERSHGPFPSITDPAFDATRFADEKLAAGILAALAAAVFFLCALRYAPLTPAVVATFAFAFGTEMWSIGSQALWQHGPVALVTLVMMAALLSLDDRPKGFRALALAGLAAGFLFTIRPTAAAFSIAGFAFAAERTGRKSWVFVLAALAGAAPGLWWNLAIFHTLLGGYTSVLSAYAFTFAQAAGSVPGLLVSPNRGLLVFSALVVLSAVGAFRALRARDSRSRLLIYSSAACALTFANYVFFLNWNAGATFGPRYLTELMPTAGLLLTYALPKRIDFSSSRLRAAWAIAAILIGASAFVQFVGVNGDPKTNWSEVPTDISFDKNRVWQWHDGQIWRDALATYRLWAANPTFTAGYANGFNGEIEKIAHDGDSISENETLAVFSGSKLALSVTMKNTGSSPWYGYTSGFGLGQTRLRVRYLDSAQRTILDRDLFLPGAAGNGGRTEAAGDVDVPAQPGDYTAVFDIDVAGNARIGSRHVGARSIRIRVVGEPGGSS